MNTPGRSTGAWKWRLDRHARARTSAAACGLRPRRPGASRLRRPHGRARRSRRDPRRQPPLPRRGGGGLRRQVGDLVRRDRPPAGARQGHEAARRAARAVRALARDRRRDRLLHAQSDAGRRDRGGDLHGHLAGDAGDARGERGPARPRGRDRGLRRRRAPVRGRELRPRARPRRAAPPARPRAGVRRVPARAGARRDAVLRRRALAARRPDRRRAQARGGAAGADLAAGDAGATGSDDARHRCRRPRPRGAGRRARVRAGRPLPARRAGRLRGRPRARRGAARELVRLVQPLARGERGPAGHPVGLDPVRLPRLHPLAGGRPARARAAAARRISSTT